MPEITRSLSNLLIISTTSLLFAIFARLSPIPNCKRATKGCMDLSKLSQGEKKKNSICPSTAHSAVNSNQWPIVAGLRIHAVLFVPRLTARSLRIQRAVIFTPPFLYLEVNGCQETNEAARNSCTSTGRLPRDAEGGIKQRAARFLSEGRNNNNNGRKKKKESPALTHTPCCHLRTIRESFFFFYPPSSGN